MYTFSEYTVRKLGHLLEYMLLGFMMLVVLRVYTRRLLAFAAWPLFLGILVPVLDETYQLTVAGRSGQLTGVWIDFAGVVIGVLVAAIALLIVRGIVGIFTGSRR